jgi:tetratricopeptide (TPR) repeat protein/predicted aspartyl protease
MALAGAAQAACELHGVADLKVTMQGSTPLVRAKINGVDVSMIADSGASYSALSEAMVARLKLPRILVDPSIRMEGVGGVQGVMLTAVKSFAIADQPLSDVAFTVTDNEMGEGIAGLMGQNVLGLVDAYYDLPDGVIKVVHPHDCGDRPIIVWDPSRPFSTIPLNMNGASKRILAEASVNGRSLRVLFDTGAPRSMLSLEAAKLAGLDPQGKDATFAGPERGIGHGVIQTWLVPVASFKIGDEEVRNTRLRIGDMSSLDFDMLLGEDFFLSHRVYVANSQRRIYFTYIGGPVFRLDDLSELAAPAAVAEPLDADGFSRRGTAFAARRQFTLAIADLTRATVLAPAEGRYFSERGQVYIESGQLGLARADLDRALRLDPEDTFALVTRAQLRIADNDNSGALADLGEADRRLPEDADIRLDAANLYGRAGAAEAAVTQYSLWMKAHPDDNRFADALNGRCWIRALLRFEADKSIADCDAALRRFPKNAAFYDSRGLAHLRLGQNDRAIEDYDAALAIDPKIAWSLYGRGIAKLRKGQNADGQADLAAASALAPALPAEAKAHGLDR